VGIRRELRKRVLYPQPARNVIQFSVKTMKSNSKLLAILLTDLCGFTAFSSRSGRDEIIHAVYQQKALIEPIVAGFHGRLVKWIGDAALVVFESALDAILCGRAIQDRFVAEAERGGSALPSSLKVVVHIGEVSVDSDGDIYGDAVNQTARMEKAATAEEVYFSSTVRGVIPLAEVPHEYVGSFEFKGLPEKVEIYRTCFGRTPVVRERTVLVQTNFVAANDLAERYGWDFVHPVLDAITTAIIDTARAHGGTNRGVMQTGAFLTFRSVTQALAAIREWTGKAGRLRPRAGDEKDFLVRVAIHWGTLHVMKHTMMGEDIDVLRTLVPLGFGHEVLLTSAAVDAAVAEGCQPHEFIATEAAFLRECGSKTRWLRRFSGIPVFRVEYGEAPGRSQGS
jgi:class 3 adenylate cyclase